MYKTSLIYGLIGGIISVIYSLLLYIIGFEAFSSMSLAMVGWVIVIVFMILGGLKLRKERGGYLSYGESYVSVLLTAATASVVATIYMILLYNVIDPSLKEAMTEHAIKTSLELMEKFNTPEAEIEKAIQQIESTDSFSPMRIAGQWLWMLIMWAIISLLVALIPKKSNPNPFSEEEILDEEGSKV